MTEWIAQNWLELIGVITTIAYLILSIKQNIWLWVLGAVSSSFYIAIYFINKFYADMGLQGYYLVISIYGLAIWLSHKSKDGKSLPICKTTGRQWIPIAIATALLWGILYWALSTFTDSPVPVGDAFTTALAITATWMLTRKMIEYWLIFIVADIVSAALYINRDMQLTAILYAIYTIMAVVGYFEWRKKWKTQK